MREAIKQLVTKIIFSFLVFLTLHSCTHEFKQCNFQSPEEQLNIYNNVLTELVEHQFYNRYLGKDEERIFEAYIADNDDTANIRREITSLQNKLFNDTARFCNIYLDTVFRPDFYEWASYQTDTGKYARHIKELLSSFSENGQEIIDSLNTAQAELSPEDFHLCTSNVLSLRDIKKQKGTCAIGIVSFSKIFLAEQKNKGLLYCNFHCGGLCGFGRLLIIEKKNNRWVITQTITTWIS